MSSKQPFHPRSSTYCNKFNLRFGHRLQHLKPIASSIYLFFLNSSFSLKKARYAFRKKRKQRREDRRRPSNESTSRTNQSQFILSQRGDEWAGVFRRRSARRSERKDRAAWPRWKHKTIFARRSLIVAAPKHLAGLGRPRFLPFSRLGSARRAAPRHAAPLRGDGHLCEPTGPMEHNGRSNAGAPVHTAHSRNHPCARARVHTPPCAV